MISERDKQHVKELVANNQIQPAFDWIFQHATDFNKNFLDQVTLLKSRYLDNEKNILMNLVDPDFGNREETKIVKALLQLIDNPDHKVPEKNRIRINLGKSAGVLLLVLAIINIIYNQVHFREFFQSNQSVPVSVILIPFTLLLIALFLILKKKKK